MEKKAFLTTQNIYLLMKGDWKKFHASLNKVLNAGSNSEAIEAVEELKATGFVEAAVERLMAEVRVGSGLKKANAARALGLLKARRAVETLCKAVGEGSVQAIAALASIGDWQAVPALQKALESKNDSVRGTAVEALGILGSSEAIDELVKATQDEKTQVRLAAVAAIMRIGDKRGVEALMRRLKDENEFVREYAVEGLNAIGDNRAGEALVEVLERDSSENVVKNAVIVLARLQDQRAAPHLIGLLERGEASLRAEAAWALGVIGSRKARDALKKACSDESETVKKNAENALKKLTV